MADGENPRRARLRALLERRQTGDGDGGRLGGRAAGGVGGGNRRMLPMLRRLLQNPKGQEIVLNFLANQEGNKEEGNESPGVMFDLGGISKGKTLDDFTTSSSVEEILRYKKNVESRAKWLESILEETRNELDKIKIFLDKKLSEDNDEKARLKPAKAEPAGTQTPAAEETKAKVAKTRKTSTAKKTKAKAAKTKKTSTAKRTKAETTKAKKTKAKADKTK